MTDEAEEEIQEDPEEEILEDPEDETQEDLKCIRQLVLIAAADAKSLLSQHMASRFFAVIVLREVVIPDQEGLIDQEVEISEDPEEGIEADSEAEEIEKDPKCIRQRAPNAAIYEKSPIDLLVINLFTAMIALVKAKAGVLNQKNPINPVSSISN